MGEVLRVAGVCILGVLLVCLVRKITPEVAIVLTVALCAVVILFFLQDAKNIWVEIQLLFEKAGLDSTIFEPLVKVLGISLVTRWAGAVCADAGENSVAVLLRMAGMLCAIMAILPLLELVTEMLLLYL